MSTTTVTAPGYTLGQLILYMLRLGTFGFGGPVALVGYMHRDLVEQRLALGSVVVRTITHKDASPLVESLRAERFGVTCLPGQGATGPVEVVFTVVPRRELAAETAGPLPGGRDGR